MMKQLNIKQQSKCQQCKIFSFIDTSNISRNSRTGEYVLKESTLKGINYPVFKDLVS
jgi:hypothetical protein